LNTATALNSKSCLVLEVQMSNGLRTSVFRWPVEFVFFLALAQFSLAQDEHASNPATPSWSIIKTHSGSFTQGQQGAAYTIVVSNTGQAATSGQVIVQESIPGGLTPVSMSGNGWSCSSVTCSRSDALPAGQSFPPITLIVNVAPNAQGV